MKNIAATFFLFLISVSIYAQKLEISKAEYGPGDYIKIQGTGFTKNFGFSYQNISVIRNDKIVGSTTGYQLTSSENKTDANGNFTSTFLFGDEFGAYTSEKSRKITIQFEINKVKKEVSFNLLNKPFIEFYNETNLINRYEGYRTMAVGTVGFYFYTNYLNGYDGEQYVINIRNENGETIETNKFKACCRYDSFDYRLTPETKLKSGKNYLSIKKVSSGEIFESEFTVSELDKSGFYSEKTKYLKTEEINIYLLNLTPRSRVQVTFEGSSYIQGTNQSLIDRGLGEIIDDWGRFKLPFITDIVKKDLKTGKYKITAKTLDAPRIFTYEFEIISENQLSPNFTYTSASPKENETISFKDESTGSPTSWQWDFGDGTSSNLQNPTKKYAKAGTYKVKLTINKAGATAQSITKDIVVSIVPVLEITPKTFPNQPAEGSKLAVNVKGNIDWEVSSNAAWLKVTPAGGSGNGTVNLTIEKSTEINDRTGKLIFKAKNISDIELIVNQNKIGTSTVLQVPSNLVAKTASATSIDLTWEHIGTATNTTFSIEQEQADGTFKEIGKTATNLLVYTVSGLATNKAYCYRVKAIQGTISSEASNKTCATLSNSKFRNGVTVVTHGFQPTGSAFGNGEVNDFVRGDANQIGLCAAIKKRVEQEGGKASIYRNDPSTSKWILDSGEGNLTDEIILFYNWSSLSNDFSDGALESAADNLFAMLARPKVGSRGNIPPKLLETDLPFHLIAHSRGNILFLQMLHRSLKYFPAKKIEHFTLLDPHPAMPMNDVNSSNELSSLPGVYGSPKNYPNEPNISLPSNVIKADVIFRQANAYEPIIDEALFLKSENLFNLALLATKNFALVDWDKLNGYYGNFSGISVNNTKNKIQLTEDIIRNGTSNKLPHSGVHEWYRGTIVTDDQSFETGTRNNWYSVLPRSKYGYNLGRIGGGFENMTVVDNPIDLKTMDARTVTRTGSDLIPVFNSNFQYPAKNAMYGWAGLGGNISTDINIKSNELTFQKKSGNAEFSRLIPEIEHNFMYFNETDSFLGLQISKSHISAKINILFYNQSNESGKITLSIPESKTYFVKIPEELKGNVGKFKISLNGTANYKPVTFKKIYTSKTDVPDGEIITINWRNDEKSLIKEVIGITADGTARLSIAIGNTNTSTLLNTNRANKVVVSLSDKSGELNIPQYIGTVKPILNLQQKNDPNLIIHSNDIVAVSQQRIENAFLFDYQAPIDFNRNYEGQNDSEKNSRDIQIKVQLLDNSNSVIGEYFKTLQIVRPPLMLAHGLGGKGIGLKSGESSESTWRNFRYTDSKGKEVFFRNSDLFIAKRDINLYPTESFDKNSDVLLNKDANMKEESFDAMISKMNDQGYACAKVDYVAHSMGGSVLRNTLEKPEYKNPKNYNQGYVNKFITICTPHQGSPLGDIVKEFTPYLNYAPKTDKIQLKGINLITKYWNFDDKINAKVADAILDLAYYSGKKFKDNTVNNHQIIGSLKTDSKNPTDALEGLIPENPTDIRGFNELSETLIKAAKVKFSACLCKKEYEEINKIDNIESKSGKTVAFFNWMVKRLNPNAVDFMENSDFIVSVESQSNGKFTKFPNDYKNSNTQSVTFIDDITHNFNPKATQSLTVGNKVFELLNTTVLSPKFEKSISKTNHNLVIPNCISDCQLFQKEAINSLSIFPNPNNGTFSLDISDFKLDQPNEIQITDELGTLIYQKAIDSNCCDNILADFPRAGNYNVIVKTKNNSFSKKIIVTK